LPFTGLEARLIRSSDIPATCPDSVHPHRLGPRGFNKAFMSMSEPLKKTLLSLGFSGSIMGRFSRRAPAASRQEA